MCLSRVSIVSKNRKKGYFFEAATLCDKTTKLKSPKITAVDETNCRNGKKSNLTESKIIFGAV